MYDLFTKIEINNFNVSHLVNDIKNVIAYMSIYFI